MKNIIIFYINFSIMNCNIIIMYYILCFLVVLFDIDEYGFYFLKILEGILVYFEYIFFFNFYIIYVYFFLGCV